MLSLHHATDRLGFGCLVLSLATLLPATARADHDSFEYGGACYGYAGERQMIDALENLERSRRSRFAAVHYVARANRDVCQALDMVCDPRAKFYLQGAHDHLDAFLCHYDPCDLTDAARLVNKALRAEQLAHRPAPVHSGHVHGHGFGLSAAPYVGHSPAVAVPVAPPRPRSSLYIGGKHGGFYLNF
jgi:hypothetical protein